MVCYTAIQKGFNTYMQNLDARLLRQRDVVITVSLREIEVLLDRYFPSRYLDSEHYYPVKDFLEVYIKLEIKNNFGYQAYIDDFEVKRYHRYIQTVAVFDEILPVMKQITRHLLCFLAKTSNQDVLWIDVYLDYHHRNSIAYIVLDLY